MSLPKSTTVAGVRRLRIASIPGGPARQYRVQYLADGPRDWRLHATFADYRQAVDCCDALSRNGLTPRLVKNEISPAA